MSASPDPARRDAPRHSPLGPAAAGLARARRAAAAALVFALCGTGLAANPFVSAPEGPAPLPAARAAPAPAPLVGAQLSLRERAAAAIESFGREPSAGALAALLGAAFLYGLLHASGPGHRKGVVFSLFLGRKSKPWEPLAAGALSAAAHAGAGIALVALLGLLRGAVAGLADAERWRSYLDAGTLLLVAALALVLALRKAIALLRGETHAHGAASGGNVYAVVLASSLVPCPGATMILIFSLYAGLAWLGVLAVLAMSLGMAIVVSAAGYLAYAGREGLFRGIKAREAALGRVSGILELLAYLFLLGFCLWTAWPSLSPLLG